MQMVVAPPRGERGLKQRGLLGTAKAWTVAPPRGERGLKPKLRNSFTSALGRSPSWGAWIETFGRAISHQTNTVAPPRGERGLKQAYQQDVTKAFWSLPLVGSVD